MVLYDNMTSFQFYIASKSWGPHNLVDNTNHITDGTNRRNGRAAGSLVGYEVNVRFSTVIIPTWYVR